MSAFDSVQGSTDSELVMGAPAIAREIMGSDSPSAVRRVRHLHEMGRLPTFRLGRLICLRPATWREYIAEHEQEAAAERKAAQRAPEAAQ